MSGKTHSLKTDPDVFDAVWNGLKTFEIRFNDRDFKVGDWLSLHETKYSGSEMKACAPLDYTGRTMLKQVSHVLSGYGLADGWVCLSLATHAGAAAAEPVAWWRISYIDREGNSDADVQIGKDKPTESIMSDNGFPWEPLYGSPLAALTSAPAVPEAMEALIACRSALAEMSAHCWPFPLNNDSGEPLNMKTIDAARALVNAALKGVQPGERGEG
jgi:hypothetical protein